MKKTLIVLASLVMGGTLYAANINQPIPSPISVLTPAQILFSTPTYAGEVVVCNGCTNASSALYSLCVSTESTTAQNGYIIVSSATAVTACK